jgi:hypothetical protein
MSVNYVKLTGEDCHETKNNSLQSIIKASSKKPEKNFILDNFLKKLKGKQMMNLDFTTKIIIIL